jgi:hypothetical protein
MDKKQEQSSKHLRPAGTVLQKVWIETREADWKLRFLKFLHPHLEQMRHLLFEKVNYRGSGLGKPDIAEEAED